VVLLGVVTLVRLVPAPGEEEGFDQVLIELD